MKGGFNINELASLFLVARGYKQLGRSTLKNNYIAFGVVDGLGILVDYGLMLLLLSNNYLYYSVILITSSVF